MSPSDPIYRVMISSTTRDLPAHRQAAIDAVHRCDMLLRIMEAGTAWTGDPIDFSLNLVDDADIYVGIFGFRYGYVPDDAAKNAEQRSITEMEYRRAKALKLPMYIFVMHDDHPIPVTAGDAESFFEPNPQSKEKLKKFKDELTTKHTVAFFKSADELGKLMLQALVAAKTKGVPHRPAPSPATPADDDPTIPAPPGLYTIDPYRLNNAFFGRATELKELDAWAESDDPTLVVDAIGGVGKSALTWQWVQNRAATHNFEGILWWSFYGGKGTMTNFVRHALAYLTGKRAKDYPDTNTSTYERELLRLLDEQRVLLVLDGIERIFVAYSSHDAPSRLDEQVSDEQRVRKCLEPKQGEFLSKLTQVKRSKVLISTRLFPAELENRAHGHIPGVRHKKLNGLHPDDALTLMHSYGVRGNEATIRRFMRDFGHHSLLLNVVAGAINDYEPAPGDFDVWFEDEGRQLKLSELDLSESRTQILHYALNGLTDEERLLLARIGAFRYPVGYAAVQAINPYLPPRPAKVAAADQSFIDWLQSRLEETQNSDEQQRLRARIDALEEDKAAWEAYQAAEAAYHNLPEVKAAETLLRAALKKLRERGLLQWDDHERAGKRTTVYDLHPVVRAYALEGLQGDAKQATYLQIRDHFEAIPAVPLEEVSDLADLQRDIQIYDALTRAGLFDEASDFYGERLEEVLDYQLAAYALIIELLTPLFPQGIEAPPALSTRRRQSAGITRLAGAYYQTGRYAEAVTLLALSLKIELDDRNADYLGVRVENYGLTLQSLNRLAQAERAFILCRALAEAADDANGLSMTHFRLMELYKDTGRWDEAEAAYAAFCAVPPSRDTAAWRAEAERTRAEMLFYRERDASDALEMAWGLAVKSKEALSQRGLLRLRGEVALRAGDAVAAEAHFAEAFKRAQQAGSADAANYLGGVARARLALGQHDEARRLIEEALALPNPEEVHRLYNSAAEVYRGLGERALAQEYALKAYKEAWADGPPYSWWWGLERAKKTLAALGVPEPKLPPFDRAKVEKIKHEDEIVAFIEELKAQKAKREAAQEEWGDDDDLLDDDDG